MSTEALRHLQTRRAQHGAILVVTLLFMTILTILGLAALSTGVLEEKMARNSRDYNIALQAAEAVLQDARFDLQGIGTRNPVIIGSVGFEVGCSAALCIKAASGSQNVWEDEANWTDASKSARYGQYTNNLALPVAPSPGGVAAPPRYLIEYIAAVGSQHMYRVTARAWGSSTNTMVMVQEEIVK